MTTERMNESVWHLLVILFDDLLGSLQPYGVFGWHSFKDSLERCRLSRPVLSFNFGGQFSDRSGR